MPAMQHQALLVLAPLLMLLGGPAAQLVSGGLASASRANVVAIEDQQGGFFVATGERYYAYLVSPSTNPFPWISLSVNGDQATIGTENNKTYTESIQNLNDTAKEFIDECRSRFMQELAYPQLGSSAGSNGGAASSSLSGSRSLRGGGPARAHFAYPVIPRHSFLPFRSPAYGPPNQRAPGKLLAAAAAQRPPFNYRNLVNSLLNETLAGDLYTFDLHGNILDVFSNTVSVTLAPNQRSLLYRDANYYTFSRPNMANAINRLFVVHDYVFLVYDDSTVQVKASWQLDYAELELLAQAKAEIDDLLQAWPYK